MVNPLVVAILGRGVWIAAGAAAGYLLAGGKGDKTEPLEEVMKEITPGHVGFVVRNYEVVKVLPPGTAVTQADLSGIINVRFTGHLPQQVAWEVQRLLSKGKIKLGAIEACVDENTKARLEGPLGAGQISEVHQVLKEKGPGGEMGLDKAQLAQQICFWVWMVDRMKKYHYTPAQMEEFGILGDIE